MIKSGLLASSSMLALAVLGAASSASAQFTQNDGAVCGAITPDPNGGCNAAPADFQPLGSFGVGQDFTVDGTMGTYIPVGGTTFTSRDLDWYSFTLTEESVVTIQLDRVNDGGTVVLFVGETAACPAVPFFGQELPSFNPVTFNLTAGQYYVIATTPFEPDAVNPIHACADYTLAVTVAAGEAACGTGSAIDCDVVHATPGCNDWSCCNAVCAADPSCCDTAWDADCVNNGAVAICGYFIYNCPAGGPSNDCLTSPTTIEVGDTV
ncbi:MAG: hypothetical protein SGJ11_11225, partial [Phycisphaerae bacterium]|nr:hypothetical protein [Phycisphaerae bacterium]